MVAVVSHCHTIVVVRVVAGVVAGVVVCVVAGVVVGAPGYIACRCACSACGGALPPRGVL